MIQITMDKGTASMTMEGTNWEEKQVENQESVIKYLDVSDIIPHPDNSRLSASKIRALRKAAEILAGNGYCPRSIDYVCCKDWEKPGVCANCIRNHLKREALREIRKEIREKRKAAAER